MPLPFWDHESQAKAYLKMTPGLVCPRWVAAFGDWPPFRGVLTHSQMSQKCLGTGRRLVGYLFYLSFFRGNPTQKCPRPGDSLAFAVKRVPKVAAEGETPWCLCPTKARLTRYPSEHPMLALKRLPSVVWLFSSQNGTLLRFWRVLVWSLSCFWHRFPGQFSADPKLLCSNWIRKSILKGR